MTKEEAVKWLKTTMDNYDFFPETEEVLKLAVEALEFELNCECCIDGDEVRVVAEWQGELVRCKDCIHYESDGGALMVCSDSGMVVDDTDYCSYAERREQCD